MHDSFFKIAGCCMGWILSLLVVAGSHAVRAQDDTERIFWDSVDCGEEVQVRAYLETYPGGHYVDDAVDCLRAGDSERVEERIGELLAACAAHVNANRLTSGAAGNALECYRKVLDEDPDNAEALDGLQGIENVYARWARSAIEDEDAERARTNLDKLRALNPEHPALADIQDGIDTLEERGRELARREERTRSDREFWETVSCDNQAQLASYKQVFPDGRYIQEADNCLEAIEQARARAKQEEQRTRDREFWKTVSCDSEAQLASYKTSFPDGLYMQQANECLAAIQQARLRAKSVYGFWAGTGSDVLAPSYQVSLDIRENDLTIHADYPGGMSCEGKLVGNESVDQLDVGETMQFVAQLMSGPCFKKAKVKLEWVDKDRLEYSWYKLGIRMGGGALSRR